LCIHYNFFRMGIRSIVFSFSAAVFSGSDK
jgi:hypothetical protein